MRQFSKLFFAVAFFLWLVAAGASAQTVQPVAQTASVRFGYLSYNAIFQAMPDYKVAQQKLADLKAKYDQEARRGEEEFQRLFAEFLQGRKDFPENIPPYPARFFSAISWARSPFPFSSILIPESWAGTYFRWTSLSFWPRY